MVKYTIGPLSSLKLPSGVLAAPNSEVEAKEFSEEQIKALLAEGAILKDGKLPDHLVEKVVKPPSSRITDIRDAVKTIPNSDAQKIAALKQGLSSQKAAPSSTSKTGPFTGPDPDQH